MVYLRVPSGVMVKANFSLVLNKSTQYFTVFLACSRLTGIPPIFSNNRLIGNTKNSFLIKKFAEIPNDQKLSAPQIKSQKLVCGATIHTYRFSDGTIPTTFHPNNFKIRFAIFFITIFFLMGRVQHAPTSTNKEISI